MCSRLGFWGTRRNQCQWAEQTWPSSPGGLVVQGSPQCRHSTRGGPGALWTWGWGRAVVGPRSEGSGLGTRRAGQRVNSMARRRIGGREAAERGEMVVMGQRQAAEVGGRGGRPVQPCAHIAGRGCGCREGAVCVGRNIRSEALAAGGCSVGFSLDMGCISAERMRMAVRLVWSRTDRPRTKLSAPQLIRQASHKIVGPNS